MSFEEAYEEFLLLGTKHLKKQSLVTLQTNFNNHILKYFNNKKIKELSKNDILNWKSIIYDKNFSNSFNNTLFIEFNSFLNYCLDNNYIKSNYIKELGNFKRKIEYKKIDFYTLKEFNIFIKGVDNIIYKQFFTFMFFVGTRPGETMALKFSDLDNQYININHNLTTKGGRIIDTPKNYSSIRTIKLDKKLYKDLLKLKKLYNKTYNLVCYDYFIFGGLKPLAPTTIERKKIIACNKMNIRPITLHQFRHSHATMLLENNIMINEISRRLGHSKTSTTLDIYCHTNLLQEKRVIKTLNSLRLNFYVTLQTNFISLFKHF